MSTSMTVKLGVVAWLALAGAATARAKDARPDVKTPGGEVWYDEFYSAAAPAPAVAVAAAPARGAAVHRAAAAPPRPREHVAVAVRGRGHPRRVARSR